MTSVPLSVRQLIIVDRGRFTFCYFSFKSRDIVVWRPAVFSNRSTVPIHGVGPLTWPVIGSTAYIMYTWTTD